MTTADLDIIDDSIPSTLVYAYLEAAGPEERQHLAAKAAAAGYTIEELAAINITRWPSVTSDAAKILKDQNRLHWALARISLLPVISGETEEAKQARILKAILES